MKNEGPDVEEDTDFADSPEAPGTLNIQLEGCWQQPRRQGEELFRRARIEQFNVPPGTVVICPKMKEYAIVPLEEYALVLSLIRPGTLPGRLRDVRRGFLKWYDGMKNR